MGRDNIFFLKKNHIVPTFITLVSILVKEWLRKAIDSPSVGAVLLNSFARSLDITLE